MIYGRHYKKENQTKKRIRTKLDNAYNAFTMMVENRNNKSPEAKKLLTSLIQDYLKIGAEMGKEIGYQSPLWAERGTKLDAEIVEYSAILPAIFYMIHGKGARKGGCPKSLVRMVNDKETPYRTISGESNMICNQDKIEEIPKVINLLKKRQDRYK